jgi:hypothetical protein
MVSRGRYSAGHTEWSEADGIHLTDLDALAFAVLVRRHLRDLA